MWKIGIHNGYWLGTGLEDEFDALEATRLAGAEVYEMNTGSILKFSKPQLCDFKKKADDLGLEITINGGFSEPNDLGSENPDVRKNGVDLASKIIGRMSIVGAKSWSGLTYGAWKKVPTPSSCFSASDKELVVKRTAVELNKIGKIAEDAGVNILFEVVNRYEQYLINTAEEARALVYRAQSPAFKILLDTFHMNIEEDSIVDAIKETAKAGLLGEIHLGESNRRLPGIGKTHMNWPEIFGALLDINYDGLITLEPFVVQGLPISSRICLWRNLSLNKTSESFIDDAKKSIKFVRSFIS